jgi:hypothetical protein
MNNEPEITELESLISESEDSLIELCGSTEKVDLIKFYETVDFFAKRYGLGGCRSLEEFSNMIDNTDPILINGLMLGAKHNETPPEDDASPSAPKKYKDYSGYNKSSNDTIRPKTVKNGMAVSNKTGMRRFLAEFGVQSENLEKSADELSNRKIKLKSFDYVTPNYLSGLTESEFKKLMEEMREQNDKSINFTLTDEMYRNKLKNNRGQ